MKKLQYIILFMVAVSITLLSCKPEEMERATLGPAPTEAQLNFTIEPGADAFHFVIKNKSEIPGIASWDFGNGSTNKGNEVIAYYPLPGTYTIKMLLVTSGGVANISKDQVTTETDYSIFNSPQTVALTGGSNAANGKTWVLDSLAKGHLGVGPKDGSALTWWSADPLAKPFSKGIQMYDDEINFNVNAFKATYTNHGKSYVKGYVANTAGFSNATVIDTDSQVDFTPAPGSWSIKNEGGKDYLFLTGPTAIFPCFYVGPAGGRYEIMELSENRMVLNAIDGIEGNKWNFILIPKGYVLPEVTFTLKSTATANTNEFEFELADVVVPTGATVTKVDYDFGNGTTVSKTNTTDKVTNMYKYKGEYTAKATVTSSIGTFTKTVTVTVAANNPAYAVAYTAAVTATANANEYEASLTGVTVPAGVLIDNIKWSFGECAVEETTDHTKKFTHTYMRKGSYAAQVEIFADGQVYKDVFTINVAANHPTYQVYLLDAMVMYSDFGETEMMPWGFDKAGNDGSLVVVTNPDNTKFPNRSKNVGMYTKINSQWANAYMQLPKNYRFDLRQQTKFRLLVRGKAGDVVLLKLENTDMGGDAWQTGSELRYTIKATDTWEIAEYDFTGAAAGQTWNGLPFTNDITTHDFYNHDYYNIVRIMYNPGNADATFSFYMDDLAGPHVEGLK